MDNLYINNLIWGGFVALLCWCLLVFFAYGGIVKRRVFWRLCQSGRLRRCWLLLGLLIIGAAALGGWRYRVYWEVGVFLPYLQFMLLAAYLGAMALTDWRRRIICADCSLFFVLLWLLILSVVCWRQGDFYMLIYSLGGCFLGAAVPLLIRFVRREAIGLGDAMLLGCCGLYCGFYGIIWLVFKAMFLGMLLSVALLLAKKVNMQTQLPFAPLVFAALII